MRRQLALIVIIALVLFAGRQLVSEPARASAMLPPRPTAVPSATPSPTPTPDVDESEEIGATIELRARGMPADAWTIVQWQDAQGDWHDVEGWQGTLDEDVKRGWVAPADFRKGPFRWAIYQTEGGTLLATSSSFDLPESPHQIVSISVP